MKTIYLLVRESLDDSNCVLGGYSTKELAEAAKANYRAESTNTNDYWLTIKPLDFDSPPNLRCWI